MAVVPAGDYVIVSWPAPAPEYLLETRSLDTGDWIPVDQKPSIINGRNTVAIPAASAGEFFRLRTP
jgi:hypothetical protein